MSTDLELRLAAVKHCRELAEVWGEAIPSREISKGFRFGGDQVLLVSWGRGIFKPQQLSDGPLSVMSTIGSQYDDEQLDGETMNYDYAPPSFEWANSGLKHLRVECSPIILFVQVQGKPNPEYMVVAPAFVVGFDDASRKFRLDLSGGGVEFQGIQAPVVNSFSKRYARTVIQARLHQAMFRRSVISAYVARCAICQIREQSLLDAAHIIPDKLPEGVATVRNGISLCPLHHRAYDRDVVQILPNYEVRVVKERLQFPDAESTHKLLTRFDRTRLWVPKNENERPDPSFLELRYAKAL